jgi:predicted enzyme related to lactoylglutathione lyase
VCRKRLTALVVLNAGGEAVGFAESVAEEDHMAGTPVHVELPAGDTSRAKEFYGKLFGWQWQSMEGPQEYHMTQFSETSGGAVFPAEERGARIYFDVDDINAGAAKVKELGGQADDPQPVPGMGWFATAKDTEGNKIGLWQTDPSAPTPSG